MPEPGFDKEGLYEGTREDWIARAQFAEAKITQLQEEADNSHKLANHNFTVASQYENELIKLRKQQLTIPELAQIYDFVGRQALPYDNEELHLAVKKLGLIVESNELDK